jgi:hypothetical protein
MNITKALKTKKKLIKQTSDVFQKFREFNSYPTEIEPEYNPEVLFNNYMENVSQIVALKTAIHKANVNIYEKIFRLSELKSVISNLKSLHIQNGKVTERYTGASTEYTSFLTLVARDKAIEQLENEIEKIQDELEAHNATTQI